LASAGNYAKKAAHEGGLSLGRKRPKRRMQHLCRTAITARKQNLFNEKGRS
jgi:hypothetical protein